MPRLLQLLMVEPKGAELLGRAVAQKAADLPGWIWLPWVPQLMTSLQRPEVAVARRILSAAAGAFPQQLYWHVRPGMLAMKDAAVKAVQDAKAQASYIVPILVHASSSLAYKTCWPRFSTQPVLLSWSPFCCRPMHARLQHSRTRACPPPLALRRPLQPQRTSRPLPVSLWIRRGRHRHRLRSPLR